jgi:hypothetical protein
MALNYLLLFVYRGRKTKSLVSSVVLRARKRLTAIVSNHCTNDLLESYAFVFYCVGISACVSSTLCSYPLDRE